MNRRGFFAALLAPLALRNTPILLLRPVNSPIARVMAGQISADKIWSVCLRLRDHDGRRLGDQPR